MFYDVLCLLSILGFLLSERTSGVSPVIFVADLHFEVPNDNDCHFKKEKHVAQDCLVVLEGEVDVIADQEPVQCKHQKISDRCTLYIEKAFLSGSLLRATNGRCQNL